MLTQGLRGIRAAVEAPPGDALGQLDSDDKAYLGTFLAGINPDMALQIGEQPVAGKTELANAYNMFTNPAIGGIDPARFAENPNLIPQGLRPFVYDYQDSGIFQSLPGRQEFNTDMERFNSFGDLMRSATVMPGDHMARDLTRAAIDVQTQSNEQYDVGSGSGHFSGSEYAESPNALPSVADTGSSGLLHSVGLNSSASAGILNDLPLRDELLGTQWEESSGVASVVNSGTTIPQDILNGPGGHNAPEAKPYVDAGYHVLEYAAGNPESINAEYAPQARHADLEASVGDTAMRYMDMIAQESESGGIALLPNSSIFGEPYEHSFGLSDEQRRGLFTTMANADAPVRNAFFEQVGNWEGGVAADIFQRSGNVEQLGSEFTSLGRVAGAMEYAQNQAHLVTDATASQSYLAGVNSGGTAVKDAVDGFARKLPILGTYTAIAEVARQAQGDAVAAEEMARQSGLYYGDWHVRSIVADAALQTGFDADGVGSDPGQRPQPLPADATPELEEQWRGRTGDWAGRVEDGRYRFYSDDLMAGYRQGNGSE
jgi:hypothetical protein